MMVIDNESIRGPESRHDLELIRINEFSDVIGRVVEARPIVTELDYSEYEPVLSGVRRFLAYERTGVTGLYLDPSFIDADGARPSFYPLVSRAGKNSMHGVFFGHLLFEGGKFISVAVKPHKDDPERSSLKEYFNNRAVNEIGYFSLQPVGVVLDHDKKAYSMTRLQDTLTTLDSIDWSNFYPDISSNPGMVEIWSQVARQLANLHADGNKTHGDLAARNIATTAEGGIFFIDWERSFISMLPPRDAEVRYSHSHQDLASLVESMCRPVNDKFKAGIGVFYGKHGDWWEGFKTLVLDEYLLC